MKKMLSLILALLLAAVGMTTAMAVDDTPMADEGYYYVYTENGKTLNVRNSPGGQVVGQLKYGTRVYCYYKDGGNGWALIDFTYDMPGVGVGTYACYVSSRFLVKNKPAARTKKTETAQASATVTAAPDPLEAINAEFNSAKRVTPYKVTVRPSRASGWVPMHWAPSATTTIMATYGANAQLLVLKETDNWLQVEDQDTGDVGFISKTLVAE
ncbi:MAG: hypothetical protein IKE24_04360 [Clostridia bacterium]|nr:hypothetical protein [Clostridia bacterium]